MPEWLEFENAFVFNKGTYTADPKADTFNRVRDAKPASLRICSRCTNYRTTSPVSCDQQSFRDPKPKIQFRKCGHIFYKGDLRKIEVWEEEGCTHFSYSFEDASTTIKFHRLYQRAFQDDRE